MNLFDMFTENSLSTTKEVELKFHTIELKESEISSYTKKYFECYNIDKPHTKFLSNIKLLGNKKLNESAESADIAPFIQLIKSVDTSKTIKVGDHFSVLAFEIVFAWKEINASGFTNPKEIVDIKTHTNGTINYIEFADGDRYPRMTPATYQGKPIIQTAYFNNATSAESALTALSLKVPEGWDFDTSDIKQDVAEGSSKAWAVTGTWTQRKYMREPMTTTTKVIANSPEEAMRKYKSYMWNELERKVIDMKVEPYTGQGSTAVPIGEQGVVEADQLPGTPVVSLKDLDDKDTKKNRYGQTVPKKLKQDDPRVKFHKDKKKGVAEGWKGPLIGATLGGLIGGPVGAFAGGVGMTLLGSKAERLAKQRKLGSVYKVYFDNKDIDPNSKYNIDEAHKVVKELSSKPHDIEKWFNIVNSLNGKVEYKYRSKTDLSDLLGHGNSVDPNDIPDFPGTKTHSQTTSSVNPNFKYKNVKYFTKGFIDRIESIAKGNSWDVIKTAGYLQELSKTNDHPFGHPTDWQKLKSLVSNDYNTESLRELGQTLKSEFKKSKEYYRTKENPKQGVAEETGEWPFNEQQEELISEAIGGLDLANAIFKALDKVGQDVVRQFGHEVVGDAIMDVVDDLGEIHNMSDLDMAVNDVLDRLQNVNEDTSDPELEKAYAYAKGHYPEVKDPQQAFNKLMQRSQKHGLETDQDQNQKIAQQAHQINDLQHKVNKVLARTDMKENRHYFITAGTNIKDLRKTFGLRKDNTGWFLSEDNKNFKKLYLEATRTFTEYDLSKHTVSANTIGDDNFVSPVGSVPRSQQKKVKKNG